MQISEISKEDRLVMFDSGYFVFINYESDRQ